MYYLNKLIHSTIILLDFFFIPDSYYEIVHYLIAISFSLGVAQEWTLSKYFQLCGLYNLE